MKIQNHSNSFELKIIEWLRLFENIEKMSLNWVSF